MPSPKNQTITINISSLSIAKVLIVAGALFLLYLLRDIVAILFVSLILASALSPVVSSLERRRIPRGFALLLIYVGFAAMLGTALFLLIPILITQSQELAQSFPAYSERFVAVLRNMAGGSEDVIISQIKNSLKAIESVGLSAASGLFGRIFDVLGGFAAAVIVAVVTFYMTVEESIMKRAMRAVVPDQYHDYAVDLIGRIQTKIGQWFRAQMILCVIIFMLSLTALFILQVPYALTLAMVAGLTEFIPLIGPLVGAIPAVFIAFTISPWLALWVLIAYWVIQRVENDLLVPKVMQQAVGINPLISVIVILIGAKIGGIVGVMLAIPVSTVIGVVLGDFWGGRITEDEE